MGPWWNPRGCPREGPVEVRAADHRVAGIEIPCGLGGGRREVELDLTRGGQRLASSETPERAARESAAAWLRILSPSGALRAAGHALR